MAGEHSGHYVGGSHAGKPHNIKHEELTEWLRIWGIIGKLRGRLPLLRAVPCFDKGLSPIAEKGQ